MEDPHGPTRIAPAPAPLTGPTSPSQHDERLQDIRRAVGDEYEVLGEIGAVTDEATRGVAVLARRQSSTQLDALVLRPGVDVQVLGTVGDAISPTGDHCPNCRAPIRTGVRFCGNCRTNLSALPLTDAPDSITMAEWIELKAEVGRHRLEVLGRISASAIGPSAVRHGVVPFIARTMDTSHVVVLHFEHAPAGGSAAVSLDQSGMLAQRIESLLRQPAAPVPTSLPVVPSAPRDQRPAPPPVDMTAQPVAPPMLATPATAMPPWAKVAILTASSAVILASVAWMISAISNGRDEQGARAALDSIRADSLRADVSRRERERADSIRSATAIDSATLRIAHGSLPENAMIRVDGKSVARTPIRLAPGRHIVSARALGYATATDTLDVQPGQQASWSPRLTALAPPPSKRAAVRRVDTSCTDAFTREEWSIARTTCETQAAANGGSGAAERTLGDIYARGLGVPKNASTAAAWYAKSAAHEDALGQYRYGVALRDGRGVNRDQRRAVELFRASAREVLDAQFALGDAFDRGAGIGRDRAEAARWYRRAGDLGQSDAQYGLGLLYERGDGVERSREDAVRWFQKAEAQGNEAARRELGRLGIRR